MIPGIKIRSTKDNLSKDTRMAMMVWSYPGMGKTVLSGSLHRLTTKHLGKPTLFIAMETGDGGGTASLRGLDIPMYVPKSLSELRSTLSALKNDKDFGGVVADSASELVKSYIKPVALKFTPREKSPVLLEPRAAGIPTQSDYGSMGELCRQVLQDLINLSASDDPELRKHVVVTSLRKDKQDDGGRIVFDGPSLPGAMATESPGMFQQVGTIETKSVVVNGKRTIQRYLVTNPGDTVKSVRDRYNILPSEILLKNPLTEEGSDLCDIWEQYWLPEIQKQTT